MSVHEQEVSSVSRDMASQKVKEPSPPPEEEKARAAKSASPSHPPYFQMIKEAIMALKERGGSSSCAIAKHVEGNYNSALSAHFRKMLKVKLKNSNARGRLLKVKGSYKLFRHEQKLAEVKKFAAAGQGKKSAAAGRGKKPEASDAAVRKHKASARQKNKAPAAGSNLPPAAEAKPAKSTKAGAKTTKKVAAAKYKIKKAMEAAAA